MTKDDILSMAGQVDAVTKVLLDRKEHQGMNHETFVWFLERFAALVAEKEREACAKDADYQWVCNPNVPGGDVIRARGNK